MTFEELMKLKVGDRVIAKEKTNFNTKKGDMGTVVFKSYDMIDISWDRDVYGWGDENIEQGHGETIGKGSASKIEKFNSIHKLVITCEDGKHTDAKYYINNKLVSESNTSRNEKYDDFDFKTAVDLCIDRMDFTDKTVTKGKGLIGRKIKAGQRVRIINVEPHRDDWCVCLDEYIGKKGMFNSNFTFSENGFGGSITFDKKYMNAIDEENGELCWRWDEIELI